MKLPGGEKASVDRTKLTEYCLDADHPRGRYKARVFASVLGIGASMLEEALIRAAREKEAQPGRQDEYGSRYIQKFEMTTRSGCGTVIVVWIVRTDEDFPRLVTCYLE